MTNDNSAAIVSKVWDYPPSLSELRRTGVHVVKNAGVGYCPAATGLGWSNSPNR